MSDFVLGCVDGGNFNKAVCDYGVFVSNNTKAPLRFLNIVEHSNTTKDLDLSGNISLGSKDELLKKLSDDEELSSKQTIQISREFLQDLKHRAKQKTQTDVSVALIHGEVVPTLIELKNNIKIALLGINSKHQTKIGDNIQEIIREIHKPVLLVNQEFTQPKKILIAYNGSNESKEILRIVASNPLLGDVQRTIINSNKNKVISQKLLTEAKEIFASQNISVETQLLQTDKQQIITYFNENNFDILVMGAYKHSRLKEFIFGSFTSFVLENINKPILLFR